MGSVERIGTVCEVFKPYIRGKTIAYASRKNKKEQLQRIVTVEAELNELERIFSQDYNDATLRRMKSSFYESGEKAG